MATFVKHAPCPDCGSKDNLAIYSDGSTYCFSDDCTVLTKPKKKEYLMVDLQNVKIGALPARGISKDTCETYGYEIGLLNGQPVQIANYIENNGEVYLKKIRTQDKSFTQLGETKKPGLFGQHLFKPSNRVPIVITEGEIDALSVAEINSCKYPVVSVRNGASNALKECKENLEYLSGFKNIIVMFDQDDPGRRAASQVATLFEPGYCKVAHLPMKDANEMLKAGKRRELQKCIWDAKEYRPDGIVAGKDLSLEYLTTPMPRGYDIPYPILSENIRGLCKKRLHVFTAMTGAGKTTISKEITYHLLKEKSAKIAGIFLEEGVNESAWSYIALDNNIPLYRLREDPQCMPEEQFMYSYDRLINNDRVLFYDHFGSVDSENLYAKLEYMAVSAKVDFIVLDNLSIMVGGLEGSRQGERKDIDIFMNKVRSLIQRTGVGVIMIVQLIKTQQHFTSEDEWETIDISLLKGSGGIAQTSDTVIALERSLHNNNERRIKVLKNRVGGQLGVCDQLSYNPASGRLTVKKEKF